MKQKKQIFTLFVSMVLSLTFCTGGGSSSNSILFALTLSQLDPPADLYFTLGFPGSANTITDDNFTGTASDYSISIDGVAATGLAFNDPTTLQFTMPTLPGVNQNKNATMIVLQNGTPFMTKTVRYRSLVEIPIGQPHGYSNFISSSDISNFYSFTSSVSGDHLFNVFGYSFTNVDLYYLDNANSSPVAIAQSSASDTEFKKYNISSTGQHIIEIRYVSGLRTKNVIQIADGIIAGVHTTNEIMTYYRCYDFMSGASTPSNHNCFDQNNAVPDRTRTGRCTYPTSGGIVTRSYYIDSTGFGFDVGYAEGTCTLPGFGSYNVEDAIFQDN
ncbi:hypothetical protein EHQ53_13910 [Leptospira langatensis]|uniref:Lipoprotein n=1 Tax=Leptospira langatensis TaxID=2484983 RepID=A0A5F1ZTV8_9LEPT|nr:hypothetical protein [Leptospira langatensis]TGK02543.1 hypothetical protein EHO57_04205 [Leptospira langatensis]TGL40256.1 hypothetical protein EHQ53_13910 [Leptospira langatensis]